MSGEDHLVRMFRSHSVFTEQQSLFKFPEREAEGVLVVLLCGMLTCQVVSKVVLEPRLLQPESEALTCAFVSQSPLTGGVPTASPPFYLFWPLCPVCLHDNKRTFEKHFWLLQLSVYNGITPHFVLCFDVSFYIAGLQDNGTVYTENQTHVQGTYITVMSFVLSCVIMSTHILL